MKTRSEITADHNSIKILYFSCVPWGWIRQRPHFVAEGLAKDYLVDYCYVSGLKRFDSVKNKFSNYNLKIKRIFKPPFLNYFSWFNIIVLTLQLKILLKKYDILWINGRCELFQKFFNAVLKKPFIIYDCLDDQLEFSLPKNNATIKEKIADGERNIVQHADLVFCSSQTLTNKIRTRYNIKKNIYLVNNAMNISAYQPQPVTQKNNTERFVITYIGTISEWFDFESLLITLQLYSNIEYHLYGARDFKIPNHPSIKYKGTLEHSEVFKVMATSDALIMPFKINELIRSVDPVKIYEYIFSGKPVISTNYEETKKFEAFVHLYNDQHELNELISNLTNEKLKPKVSEENRIKFGNSNSWDERLKIIFENIEQLFQLV